jgi:hypothetical protein
MLPFIYLYPVHVFFVFIKLTDPVFLTAVQLLNGVKLMKDLPGLIGHDATSTLFSLS